MSAASDFHEPYARDLPSVAELRLLKHASVLDLDSADDDTSVEIFELRELPAR